MLSPYRVLDLTDEKGLLCGKLLGDMGADVIKIEQPGGDPARNIGPFYHDEVHPDRSLFWWAYNSSKRGITLDIESAEGREAFKNLVRTAEFVLESFPPGYLDKRGLGYSSLAKINPGIIMVSITPFGQTGPYRDYRTADIVSWAMGGQMYPCGGVDRAPVRVSHHSQAYLNAGADAAIAAMAALHHRKITGEGQHMDISVHESVVAATYMITAGWDMMKTNLQRGSVGGAANIRVTRVWPCKDGYVLWIYWGGTAGMSNRPFVKWMEEEGMADDFLRNFDWDAFDFLTTTQDIIDRMAEPTRKFFMARTKAQLYEGAVRHRVTLYPVSTAADIAESAQLAAREFSTQVEHPDLGTTIAYPGVFAHYSDLPPKVLRRAPLVGEHNREIFEEELARLSDQGVVSRQSKPSKENSEKGKVRGRLLKGIRIADFTWVYTGPLTTKTLADCGAEVIKIEGRTKPDVLRTSSPFKDGVSGLNRSGHFNQYNTCKRSIALNLAHPGCVDLAKRFVAWADVVVENFAGGVMNRMGLGYEDLRKIKPDIVMLSTCMQGQTGPHSAHPGFGWQLTALSGFYGITGWPDREPAGLSVYTDFIAPRFNVVAILAALDYRGRTGKGQYIDMSQYENGLQFLTPLVLDYVVNGRVPNREGNRDPYAAPHNAYRCRGEDRWCAIAVFTDEEWQSFCNIIGDPPWSLGQNFASLQARKENEDELDRLVEAWTIGHSAEDVMALMQRGRVAGGVLQTGEDLIEHDPQLRYRRFFWELDHPEAGKQHCMRPPFLPSKSYHELERAPLLGEHNEYALKDVLGMSDEEVAQLVLDGVIE